MPIPQGTDSFPLGFFTASVDGDSFAVDAYDVAEETTRLINRTNLSGDVTGYQVRKNSEYITGTITLQRASNSTAIPKSGSTIVANVGTSTLDGRITDVKVIRSKDSVDVFECGVLVISHT